MTIKSKKLTVKKVKRLKRLSEKKLQTKKQTKRFNYHENAKAND